MERREIWQTSEFTTDRTTPCCPKCREPMDDASIKLGAITLCWPLPTPEALRSDGYTDQSMVEVKGGPIVECPSCNAVSLFSIRGNGLVSDFVLTLVRTDADRRFLGETV